MQKTGIIGGSGFEDPKILTNIKYITVDTPFGPPSSELICGKAGEAEVVIVSRHGRQHTITPGNVNNRANVYALKEAGCTNIIATTACGSLREEIGRGDLVFPDQFIDFTKHRKSTFFDSFAPGELKHTPMADPFDKYLRQKLSETAIELSLRSHSKATVITIEGPRFSTRAESHMFRAWGADIINMSTAPECTLANEAGIPYAAVAMSTDYDCWKEDEAPVTWDEIIAVFRQNVENVVALITRTVAKLQ